MRTPTKTEKQILVCPTCGNSGTGVIKRLKYVGGIGVIQVVTCEDEVACWERYDQQHGLS